MNLDPQRRHTGRRPQFRSPRAREDASGRRANVRHVSGWRRRRAPRVRSHRGRSRRCPAAWWYREPVPACKIPFYMPTAPGSSPPAATVTPAMRQYLDAKRQYRDAIVLFRMGDFYEMFYEDALVAARALDLTLTSRSKDAGGNGIPMCGVPYHALDGYLSKLVKKGFRVAICEQVEDPKKAKGLVKRAVVRVVSPGTLTDSTYLDARQPSFLMAIVKASDRYGAAVIDISTGEFTAAEYRGPDALQALADEISVLRPREVVVSSESSVIESLPEIAR